MSGYDGYGIRARKDLTANPRSLIDRSRALHAAELETAARTLNGMISHQARSWSTLVAIPKHAAARLVDALLLAAQILHERDAERRNDGT